MQQWHDNKGLVTIVQQTNGLGIGLPTPSATKYFVVNFSWHKLCDNIALKLIPPCKGEVSRLQLHEISAPRKLNNRATTLHAMPTKALLLLHTQEYHTTRKLWWPRETIHVSCFLFLCSCLLQEQPNALLSLHTKRAVHIGALNCTPESGIFLIL